MILVVGASGQLGCLVVHALRDRGRPVRAMVRDRAVADDLAVAGVQIVDGDLTRPETLDAALEGVTAIIATANVVAPVRAGDTVGALDAGYAELIIRAQRAGVSRFVLASVPETPLDDRVPVAASKRNTERRLAGSSLSWLSLRMPPFTEVWLALVGSELPLRGERRATLAGPEVLAWTDVAAAYARVLDRRVRAYGVPARAYAVPQRLFARVAPSLAGTMGLNRLIATSQTDRTTPDLVERLGIGPLRTVEAALREKAALPGDAR